MFRQRRPVEKEVRRLVKKQIAQGLECLDQRKQAEGIHGVRKQVKKIRSLLRLVRAELKKEGYKTGTKLLRKIAGDLADARDAHVRFQAFQELVNEGAIQSGTYPHIAKFLAESSRSEVRRFLKEGCPKEVERRLSKLKRHCKRLRVRSDGWVALAPGVQSSYSQGRRAKAIAHQNPTPENFHGWRKRVKELWYDMRLLRPVNSEFFEPLVKDLKKLGELIGDDHDLTLLEQALADAKDVPQEEADTIKDLLGRRHADLRREALDLGERIYGDKTLVFCRHIGKMWETWEAGKDVEPEGA